MKRTMYVVLCLCAVGMANAALSITNGDFEIGGGDNVEDVTGWYDLNTGTGFWEGAWQTNNAGITPNGTMLVVLSGLGNGYLYQSVGLSAGEASIDVKFDWGHPLDVGAGRTDAVSVSAYVSDGTFVAGDGVAIAGAAGITLLDSATVSHTEAGGGGEMWTEIIGLDLSGASAGQEIFLSFDSAQEWPVLDNVSIVPEPATMVLLGLGGLFLRRKR